MQRLAPAQRRLAISLAALAGFVDSIGFLSAGGYFFSFMSGNTTRLAVDLATDRPAAVLPALLILGFTCGVFIGAVVALKSGPWQARNVLALVAILLIASMGFSFSGAAFPALSGMVLAMGALNNAFQREGSSSFGLTYMTGAVVRFAQGLAYRLCGRKTEGFGGLLALWAALAGGAVLGAFAHLGLGMASISAAAALAIATLIAAMLVGPDRRDQA